MEPVARISPGLAQRPRPTHDSRSSRWQYHRLVTELEAAWDDLHDGKPDYWFVGTPVYIERRGWEQYTHDTRERHKHGRRTREWTAVAQSELGVHPRDGAVPAAAR